MNIYSDRPVFSPEGWVSMSFLVIGGFSERLGDLFQW
jgi:hypothetical protein